MKITLYELWIENHETYSRHLSISIYFKTIYTIVTYEMILRVWENVFLKFWDEFRIYIKCNKKQ